MAKNRYKTLSGVTRKTKWDASKLLGAAFKGTPRLAITEMLRSLAEMTGSFGAVIWRANRSPRDESKIPPSHLNLLAGWFDTEIPLSIGRVPIENPRSSDGIEQRVIASEAFRTAAPSWSNDLTSDGILNCTHNFLREHDIKRTLAVPVEFVSERKGAISIYRNSCQPELGEAEAKVLQMAAKHLPELYHARWTEAAYKLLEKTERIAHANKGLHAKPASEAARTRALRDWAIAVKEAFQCQEVSIYLRDEQTIENFKLRFTTPGAHKDTIRHEICSGLDYGFSGLVLHTRKPLRIHDTQNCKEQEDELRVSWPGFKGHSVDKVSETTNKRLAEERSLDPQKVMPPHAYLAVPIVEGERLIGLVRCWFLRSGRQFFSGDDENLLELATENLAHLVERWGQESRNEREQKAWMEFASRAVKGAVGYKGRGGGVSDIFVNGLRLVDKVLPGDYVNTVRLVDSKTQQLYCYAYPTPSDLIKADEIEAEVNTRNHIEGPNAKSLGAAVCREKQTKVFENVERFEREGYTPRFSGVKHMIIAPIMQGKNVVGLLDVRSREQEVFPQQAQALVDYIAKMMGVQYTQQQLAGDLWKAKKRQADMDHIQARAYEDIAHQTKGPLTNAERTLQGVLDAGQFLAPSKIASVHGMVQRALNMSKIVGTIAKLGADQNLDLGGTSDFGPADWVKLANSVYSTNLPRLELDPRRLRLKFDANSFWKHAPASIRIDGEYVTQAIYCLVDNAIKYSYPETRICIFADTSKSGRFCITVSNEGLPIRTQDTSRFKLRGTRGEEAKNLTGEGNGIGLWIVDHIMRAHQGELEINATRKRDGVTEIRLIFVNQSIKSKK